MVTLEAVRNSVGLTIGEAAKHCGIPVDEMKRLEDNVGEMPASMVTKLRRIYKFPIDYVSLFLLFGIYLVAQ